MNSSKSALLAAIIGTASLVVAFGLIFAFVPGHKKLAILNAEGNSAIVALDWIKVKNPEVASHRIYENSDARESPMLFAGSISH